MTNCSQEQRSAASAIQGLGPIIATPGDEAHALAIALHAEAVPIVLDFVEPLGARRHGFAGARDAELEFGHSLNVLTRGRRSSAPVCVQKVEYGIRHFAELDESSA
jgi:hypothetical protein